MRGATFISSDVHLLECKLPKVFGIIILNSMAVYVRIVIHLEGGFNPAAARNHSSAAHLNVAKAIAIAKNAYSIR